MSLAVTLDLAAPSQTMRLLRWLARAVVAAGSLATLGLGWLAFIERPPAASPAAAHDHSLSIALGLTAVVLAAVAWTLRLSVARSQRARAARSSAREPWPHFGRGLLHIDDAGAASWQADPESRPIRLQLHDVYLGQRLASLRFKAVSTVGSPRRQRACAMRPHLLLARDAMPPEHWRRLRVWVIWRQRGGRDAVVL